MSEDIINIEGLFFKKYLTENQIQQRIAKLSQRIQSDYTDRKPVFVVVLQGAYMFASDLMKAIHLDAQVSFVRLSSYEGTQSTGNLQLVMDSTIDLEGKDVIIVEDIVDTGATIHFYIEHLRNQSCKSVAIASLLVKPKKLEYDLDIAYRGFDIEDAFVVGYGLDYNEYGRMYADIYQLYT